MRRPRRFGCRRIVPTRDGPVGTLGGRGDLRGRVRPAGHEVQPRVLACAGAVTAPPRSEKPARGVGYGKITLWVSQDGVQLWMNALTL